MVGHLQRRASWAGLLLAVLGARAGHGEERWSNRMPTADGAFVEVRESGSIGRWRLAPDGDINDEYAALRERAKANRSEPLVWRAKFFIVRSIEAPVQGYRDRFTDEEVQSLERLLAQVPERVRSVSQGSVRLDAEVVVLDAPLGSLDVGDDGPHPWIHVMASLIDSHVPHRGVDSILVYWPGGGNPEIRTRSADVPLYRGARYGWIAREREQIEHCRRETVGMLVDHMVGTARDFGLWTGLPDPMARGHLGYHDSQDYMYFRRDLFRTCATPGLLSALEPRRPSFDGGFVREFLVAAGPVEPTPGPEWKPAGAADVLWLHEIFGQVEKGIAYAQIHVRSPTRRHALLWAGADDHLLVFANGREIWRNEIPRGCFPDHDRVPIELEAGWNRILFKVVNRAGWWGLMARFSDLEGDALPDLEIRASRPAEGEGPIVEVVNDPLVAAAWEPRVFEWARVASDPWRILPELGKAELARLLGDPGVELASGDHFTAVVTGEAAPTSGQALVDGTLDFAGESLAWIRAGEGGDLRDLVLVRPDVLDFWLAHLDALEDPALRVIGKITIGNRPLVALWTRLAHNRNLETPASELSLAVVRHGSFRANLVAPRRDVAIGDEVEFVLRQGELGSEASSVPYPVVIPRDLALVGQYRPIVVEIPYETGTTRGKIQEVEIVRCIAPIEISLWNSRTGRRLRTMRTGDTLDVEVRITSHLSRSIELTLVMGKPQNWKTHLLGGERFEIPARGEVLRKVRVTVPEAEALGEEPFKFTATVREKDGDEAAASETVEFQRSPWLLVGPFDNEGKKGFATRYPPEVDAFDRSTVFDAKGGKAEWVDLVPAAATATEDEEEDEYDVDFDAIFEPNDWGVAYAALDLDAKEERDVVLSFGSDDTLTVWLDGEQVESQDVYRAAEPGQNRALVRLDKNVHRLLVKVCDGVNEWRLLFELVAPDGTTFEDEVRLVAPR